MPKDFAPPAQIAQLLPDLHGSLNDIVALTLEPERDSDLLHAAGLRIDRVLLPVLLFIKRHGPLGVVQLAGRLGRDYTTVSRQVARLENLGLVARRPGETDRRIRQATVTSEGAAAIDAVNAARDRVCMRLFSEWTEHDFCALVTLARRLADGLRETRPMRCRPSGLPIA